MKKFVRVALALASVAMVAPAYVAAQAKPVVAVMYFDNNSIGKDHADYDGVGKGMAEMLINDLATANNVTVVERERIQALLVEQNLTKAGSVDPQTAIKIGKIIGAQYMITGGFMSDGRGNVVLTGRTINVQTSAIGNPTRINAKGDDVLGMIAQLSEKMRTDMKLPVMKVGDAGNMGGAQPAGAPAAAATTPAIKVTKDESPKPKAESQVAQARPKKKMDMKTALLYSKALEEEDAGNRSKAVELYKQVNVSFPDYAPVQQKIAKLSHG